MTFWVRRPPPPESEPVPQWFLDRVQRLEGEMRVTINELERTKSRISELEAERAVREKRGTTYHTPEEPEDGQ